MAFTQPPYQQPPPQPPYPQTVVYAYGTPPAPPRGLSVASMVIGFVSILFGFTFVLPAIGLILGFAALGKEPAGRGMAVTGVIINGIFIAGWVLLAAVVIIFVIASSGTAAGAHSVLS